MNSFVFSKIKESYESCDYNYASTLLNKIDYHSLNDSGRSLYDHFLVKLKKKITIKNEPEYQDGLLSFHDDKSIIPGISLVSCCMNRNENLVKSMHSWLKLSVDEIIVVDWSSTMPVADSLSCFDDQRIKIIRVEGEKKWVLTYAFNVGLRFARFSKVFKLDADIHVKNSFLETNYFAHGEFIRGSWEKSLEAGLDDQIFVNGSFGACKADLEKIGYYNEYITTYGWDDSDLYERLAVKAGLKTKYLMIDSLIHIEQKQEERTINQSLPNSNFLGNVSITEFNNSVNKYIARVHDFWTANKLNDYFLERKGVNYWVANRTTEGVIVSHDVMRDSRLYAASLFSFNYAYDLFSIANNAKTLNEFLLKEYYNDIPYDKTKYLLGFNDDAKPIFVSKKGENPLDFIVRVTIENKDSVLVYVCEETPGEIHKIRDGMHFINNEEVELVNFFRERNKKQKINFTHSTNLSSDQRSKFYIDAQHGLGNRLRAIGSAAAIAKATGRELVIVWEPDHHCDCSFFDLFEYDGAVIEKSFIKEAKRYGMNVYNYMEIEEGSLKDEPIPKDLVGDIYGRSAYIFQSEHSSWSEENKFIRSLTPSKKVEELIHNYSLGGCIGVHVRMEAGKGLDHNTYDDVSNWTEEGHEKIHYWREKSHHSHFIKRIEKLMQEEKDLEFFLATDLPETYKVFQDFFGEKCYFLQREVFDRSKEQIIYALADAILLSKCSRLLGSTWSSFSELALRLSDNVSTIEMSGVDF